MVKLKENTKPILNITPIQFRRHTEDGFYFNVPVKYFEIEKNKVLMRSRFAVKINWNIDCILENIVNINAKTCKVNLDDNTYRINSGYFCCNTDKYNILEEYEKNYKDN